MPISPELELYGRIIVQLIARGIIPESLVADMEEEFSELASAASREEDRAHYSEMASRAGLLVGRSRLELPNEREMADSEARKARSRFRVIAKPDGGNGPD